MHKLIEFVCDELEQLEQKVSKEHKLSMQEIQYMDTLAHAKKNLLKCEQMEEEDYSMDDGSYRGGGSYKYPYNTERYLMGGSYRGRGRNANRDSIGRYSRDGGSYGRSMDDQVTSKIRQIINAAPDERTRRQLEELLSEMGN